MCRILTLGVAIAGLVSTVGSVADAGHSCCRPRPRCCSFSPCAPPPVTVAHPCCGPRIVYVAPPPIYSAPAPCCPPPIRCCCLRPVCCPVPRPCCGVYAPVVSHYGRVVTPHYAPAGPRHVTPAPVQKAPAAAPVGPAAWYVPRAYSAPTITYVPTETRRLVLGGSVYSAATGYPTVGYRVAPRYPSVPRDGGSVGLYRSAGRFPVSNSWYRGY